MELELDLEKYETGDLRILEEETSKWRKRQLQCPYAFVGRDKHELLLTCRVAKLYFESPLNPPFQNSRPRHLHA